ncbi:MAG TPA: ABC transporter permease [Pseudomonadales bacterium]|nr:ABC transporter permease [Pseudomonadales bacterium]
MWNSIRNIYYLGLKELWSLRSDVVMCVLIVLSMTVFVVIPARNAVFDMRNASAAIVDEDQTPLSRSLFFALQPPYFKPPVQLDAGDVDNTMRDGIYTFVVWIPRNFQADMVAGNQPAIQLLVDATAMSQAGNGAAYLTEIIDNTLKNELHLPERIAPVKLNTRIAFNSNLEGSWFFAITNVINVLAMLAIVLTGAALIRERERGTVEHLLVMPLRPLEIALGKVWANSAVILASMFISLLLVVHGMLGVPLQGSLLLFMFGMGLYLFALAAIGIFLGTVARSMPQLGLLFLPVVILIVVLSGGLTPLEAMPELIRNFMQIMPSSHFTRFAMAVLFRGAGFSLVWKEILAMAGIGTVFITFSLMRFRSSISTAR